MKTLVFAVVLSCPLFASATELTCNELMLLRVILRQDMAMDAYVARMEGDEPARERALPLELVSNDDPNGADMDTLRAIVADPDSDEPKRLNAARVLAYFGDRWSVDVLSKTAEGESAESTGPREKARAAACLLYLECDLPDGFAFSRLPNPLYCELDAFVKKPDRVPDPNAPYSDDEIEKIVAECVGLGRSVEVRGPLSIAEVEQEELAETLCHIAQYHDMRSIPRLPFAYVNEDWQEFKKGMHDGDLIYYFTSDEQSWRVLCGIEGYVLIRDGEVVDMLVTAVS